jgi:hypothetical protein
MQGNLIGVALLAPFWTSMSAWGAITSPLAQFTTANDWVAIGYTIEYFYAGGEQRDGPGGGLLMFQSASQQAVKDAILGGECYDQARIQALGATPYDFFDHTFVDNVGTSCAAFTIGTDCTLGAAPTWLARWQEDRPPIDPQGAPILIFYGGMDAYVKPGLAQCAIDKFNMDLSAVGSTTMIRYCYDAAAGHRDIVRGPDADWINQWIAARAGIAGEPPACAPFPTGMTCLTPPNNF